MKPIKSSSDLNKAARRTAQAQTSSSLPSAVPQHAYGRQGRAVKRVYTGAGGAQHGPEIGPGWRCTALRSRSRPYCDRQAGHVLLELVIAFTLGLLLTFTALSLYREQRDAFARIADYSRMADAGLTALHLISVHLRLAGFAAPFEKAPFDPAIFGCTAGRPLGELDAAGPLSGCEADPANRSDSIEVRYMADLISTWPGRNGAPTDCLGQSLTAGGKTNHSAALSINRFFVRTSPTRGELELYCEGSGRSGNPQPVAAGIERLRLRYWLADAAQLVDAASIPADRWGEVTAVELCVLVRGRLHSRFASYIDCDGVRKMSADALRRETFMTWVALRNASSIATRLFTLNEH